MRENPAKEAMSPHFRFPHGYIYTIAIYKPKIIFKTGLAIKLNPALTQRLPPS